jgi:hypothetical protein
MDWNTQLDIFSKAFSILAIIVGGIWSYLKFIRGQVFAIRLEVKVDAKVITNNKINYLLVSSQIKNIAVSPVNLSKVIIHQRGSGLRIFACGAQEYEAVPNNIECNLLGTYPVFESVNWVSASDQVTEQRLFTLPKGNFVAFKLELRIVSKRYTWHDMKIVEGLPTKGEA